MFVSGFKAGTGAGMNGERAPLKRVSFALGDCKLGLLPRAVFTLRA